MPTARLMLSLCNSLYLPVDTSRTSCEQASCTRRMYMSSAFRSITGAFTAAAAGPAGAKAAAADAANTISCRSARRPTADALKPQVETRTGDVEGSRACAVNSTASIVADASAAGKRVAETTGGGYFYFYKHKTTTWHMWPHRGQSGGWGVGGHDRAQAQAQRHEHMRHEVTCPQWRKNEEHTCASRRTAHHASRAECWHAGTDGQ